MPSYGLAYPPGDESPGTFLVQRPTVAVLRSLIFLSLFASIAFAEPPLRTYEECAAFLRPLVAAAAKRELTFPVPLTVYDVPMRRGYMPLKKAGAFYDPDAVYIGIANLMGADGIHHYYLIAKNLRFDALFERPAHIHDSAKGSSPLISQGMVYKLKVPPATLEKVIEGMKRHEGKVCVTCLHPVLQIMNENGIAIAPDGQGQNQISTAQVTNGLLSGRVTRDGQAVPVEAFATSSGQVLPYLSNAINVDAMTKTMLEARAKAKAAVR